MRGPRNQKPGYEMVMKNKKHAKKTLMQAIKIAVGSSVAIYIAERLDLEYAISAGSIALLTLVTTKWETVKLSMLRLLTYALTVCLGWIAFVRLESDWLEYGVFVLLLVIISELLGLKATVSVNAVIGTHFMVTKDFSPQFILNEFLIVLIGVSIAIVLNLFYDYQGQRREIIKSMRYTEKSLQKILEEMASYLSDKEMHRNVWDDICGLEVQLEEFTRDAYEYQDNTFQSHPGYYIDYFEMRMKQLGVLHNLHYEMKKIRTMPKQAEIIAEYILYLKEYVVEVNVPTLQMERLSQIFRDMEKEKLPVTREEFESRAMLYHILMDLEEFLTFKKRFVEGMDERQQKLYWNEKEKSEKEGKRSEKLSEDK